MTSPIDRPMPSAFFEWRASRDAGPLRARPALWVALALSVLIHAAWSLWPAQVPRPPDETVLSATLTEMPAPPPSAAPPAASKPRPKRATPQASARAPTAEVADASGREPSPAFGPAIDTPLAEMTPAPVIEPIVATQPPRTLPPRLDLAYKVFLGTHGFLIGEATYRFEHHGNEYRIATVAEARGLAALFLRGRGKVESHGLITPDGLKPLEFAVERGSSDRREVARFDWDAGVVTLHEDKTALLEPTSFDPMTLMWQPYFTPPESPLQTLNLVTTRRVLNYTVEREGTETITWTQGTVDTERWHRRSDDGRIDAYFWLAPQMHYVMVKMRVSQTARGTIEALLDAIRVDEPSGE